MSNIKVDKDLNYKRRDLEVSNSDERPLKTDYDRYVTLRDQFRDVQYDPHKLYEISDFNIVDVGFNALFLRANKDLLGLAKNFNLKHNHPTSDLSGVLWIKCQKNCGNIIFEHPAKDLFDYYFMNVKNPEEMNVYNARTWWLPSKVNMLYLFPSWLNHSVELNKNKTEERISISFNTYHVR